MVCESRRRHRRRRGAAPDLVPPVHGLERAAPTPGRRAGFGAARACLPAGVGETGRRLARDPIHAARPAGVPRTRGGRKPNVRGPADARTRRSASAMTSKPAIAVLDDYQGVALELADWSAVSARASVDVFRDHLEDADAVVERLRPYEVVCVMRERTPLPRAVIERL